MATGERGGPNLVGGLLHGRGNVRTLHGVFFGPRKREFGISGLLPRQRIAESAQTSGDQE